MKKDIHPEYVASKIICSCGNVIETRSTKPMIHTEICSNCHPFFTGKQKFVDTTRRIEQYQRKFEISRQKAEAAASKAAGEAKGK